MQPLFLLLLHSQHTWIELHNLRPVWEQSCMTMMHVCNRPQRNGLLNFVTLSLVMVAPKKLFHMDQRQNTLTGARALHLLCGVTDLHLTHQVIPNMQ